MNIGLDLPLLNIRAIPNPDLKPEQSNGYEIGLRYESAALRFSACGYYTDYDDFIESKVNLGADPETKVIIFQSQNITRARIYGTEVSATASAGEWAAALSGWTARLSAAWLKGEDWSETSRSIQWIRAARSPRWPTSRRRARGAANS